MPEPKWPCSLAAVAGPTRKDYQPRAPERAQEAVVACAAGGEAVMAGQRA
jgi:hypothetical protein